MARKFSDQHMDVADHRQAWAWMTMTAREDPEGFVRLTGPNIKRLEDLYGPAHWKADGKQGWTSAWAVSDCGLTFVITAGPMSTMFYVRSPTDGEDYLSDPRVAVGIVEFLKSLLTQLKALC